MSATLPEFLSLRDIKLEIVERGAGRPIVFLHSGEGLAPSLPLVDRLAATGRVIAPSHPGFGRSDLPPDFRRIDDLAYFYLELFDKLALKDAVLVGASFGGWIAAEIAIRSTAHLSHLVLVDAFGIRLAQDETAIDIQDIFTLPAAEIERRSFADPATWSRSYDDYDDDALFILARNLEALSLYGWSPYMHNPVLKRWLHRIGIPALVLWGRQDGIVSVEHGRAYAAAIPGARFEIVEDAGHYPQVEQAEKVFASIARFAGLTPAAIS